jgi:hypothetical protein
MLSPVASSCSPDESYVFVMFPFYTSFTFFIVVALKRAVLFLDFQILKFL